MSVAGRRRGQRSSEVTKAVLAFMAAGLVVVSVISLASIFLAYRAATQEALRDAKTVTDFNIEAVIQPAVAEGLLTSGPDGLRRLDEIVRSHVLGELIVRVKIWSADGRILYSDEPRLMGSQFELGHEDRETLDHGGTEVEVSDLDHPENRFERRWNKLLEVYRPIDLPNGDAVLFEAYLPYGQVSALAGRVWLSLLPALIGGLLLLYLIQIPLAWRLARRLEEGQRQRSRLARMAAEASESERRRIAADLHDGVVQGLAGSSYALAAAADRARESGDAELGATLARASADLRCWVRDLRTLLVNIAPPKLHEEGLAAALSDLVSAAAARGITTTVDVEPGLRLPPPLETLLFRAAQEAFRNAAAHARPSTLVLKVEQLADGRVRLEVEDDGVGFDAARREEAKSEGHLGLSLLAALADQADGRLDVDSAPGRGTQVRLEVPVGVPV